jgi:hypothetical protein
MRKGRLTDRRLAAIERGSDPTPEELAALVELARMGRAIAAAPEVVLLSQGTGAVAGQAVRHTWTVDSGFDDDPAVAALVGHRVRVVSAERVLKGYARGAGWPKGPGDMRLVPGDRPPRNWQ